MDMRQIYGLANEWPICSTATSALGSTRRTCGECCNEWVGAASVRSAGPWRGTRKRSLDGSASNGHALKKTRARGTNHRLYRRERDLGAAAPGPHLVAARPNADPPAPFLLENALGDRRSNIEKLLLSTPSRCHYHGRGHRVPSGPHAPHPDRSERGVGSTGSSHEPRHPSVRRRTGRPNHSGVPAGVRARAQSCRVPVGTLEATRHSESLRCRLQPAELARSRKPASPTQTQNAHCRILDPSAAVLVTILCKSQ